jgi:hypothetical protein
MSIFIFNKHYSSHCCTIKAYIQFLHVILLASEERILFAVCFEDFSPWLDPDVSYGKTLDYEQQKYSWLLLLHVYKYLHTVRAQIQLWNLSVELGHPYKIRVIYILTLWNAPIRVKVKKNTSTFQWKIQANRRHFVNTGHLFNEKAVAIFWDIIRFLPLTIAFSRLHV